MITNTTTEIIRRVHFDGVCLEVGECPDNPDWLRLETVGEDNVAYFGEINLNMSPSFALQLGSALVAAAIEKGVK